MTDLMDLRELHDSYVWEVNEAIGEDRLDLVWRLADDYMDRALRLLSDGEPPTCGATDCAICARRHTARAEPQKHRRPLFRRRRHR